MVFEKIDVENEILRRFKTHCEKSTFFSTTDLKKIENHHEKPQRIVFERVFLVVYKC